MGYRACVLALILAPAALGTRAQHLMVRREKSQECVPADAPQTEYFRASETACAAVTHTLRGLSYVYTGNQCVVTGPGTVTSNSATSVFVGAPQPTRRVEAALGKPTHSSGDHSNFPAPWAVDGDDTTMYHSREPYEKPWWVVDLLAPALVWSVAIFPRQDLFIDRFHDIELRVGNALVTTGDFSTWTLFAFYLGPYDKSQGRLNFTPGQEVCGRFFSIQRVSAGTYPPLNIMDVRIFVSRP